MARDQLSKYAWIVDTIRRYGRITRDEINKCWMRSSMSDGKPMPRRSFVNYRAAIEELFKINIECDPSTFEYYIAGDEHQQSVTDWLLNSMVTNNLLASSSDISDRVFLEDVPSAREHLPVIIEAMRGMTSVKFDYHPYTRSLPTTGVVIEPYFTKIFKQRWYVVGRNVREDKIKTYALDRMKKVTQLNDTFVLPPDFDAKEYFTDAFGIIVNQAEPRIIEIKADSREAKYLRALPLHHSQQEMVHDSFSIFRYKMRITDDLVGELLSRGSRITVLAPRELRAMMKLELSKALNEYSD